MLVARKGWAGRILRRGTPTLDFRRDKLTEAYDTSRPFVERKDRGMTLRGCLTGRDDYF